MVVSRSLSVITMHIVIMVCGCQEYDPPSEGEVMRRPLVSAHHDPILSLLARMEQGPVIQPQQQPEVCLSHLSLLSGGKKLDDLLTDLFAYVT